MKNYIFNAPREYDLLPVIIYDINDPSTLSTRDCGYGYKNKRNTVIVNLICSSFRSESKIS